MATPDAAAAPTGRPLRVFTHRKNVGGRERAFSGLAGTALVALGLRRGGLGGVVLAALGGELVRRGVSGWCPVYEALEANTAKGPLRPVMFERSIEIERDPAALYAFWRQLDNLPRFMRHLESVTVTDREHSHWVARAGGVALEWDAVIVADVEGELIGWRSLPGALVENAGSVRFRPARGGRASVVQVTLAYHPPGGAAGKAAALLVRSLTEDHVADDLRDLKRLLEAGTKAIDPGPVPRGSDRETWQ